MDRVVEAETSDKAPAQTGDYGQRIKLSLILIMGLRNMIEQTISMAEISLALVLMILSRRTLKKSKNI